jgi:hypothetical protein
MNIFVGDNTNKVRVMTQIAGDAIMRLYFKPTANFKLQTPYYGFNPLLPPSATLPPRPLVSKARNLITPPL